MEIVPKIGGTEPNKDRAPKLNFPSVVHRYITEVGMSPEAQGLMIKILDDTATEAEKERMVYIAREALGELEEEPEMV